MESFFNLLVNLVKLPFLTLFKTLITVLNVIPLPIYEVNGLAGTSNTNRPDLRDQKIVVQGKRKLHLGSLLIAWTRGVIFKADLNSSGATCYGIYSEDYQDIQNKWVW